jgi:protein SCO1/2
MLKRLYRILAILSTALAVGCQKEGSQPFNSVDISGASYAREFTLTDHNGKKRTLADYRGKVVLLFFGYTQCPDVCPTTMADMAQVKAKLGKAGEQFQVVFVTVDPERDTPQLLAQYVPNFDPTFVGLYGSADEIARTAKEFKVFYQKVPGKTPTSYGIDHTAGSYVFDAQGRIRLFVKHSQSIDSVAADVKRLL